MNSMTLKLQIVAIMLFSSSFLMTTHYVNKTGRTITITNVSEKKRQKKNIRKHVMQSNTPTIDQAEQPKRSFWSWNNRWTLRRTKRAQNKPIVWFIELEDDQAGDLNNQQEDEITITSKGLSNKRKLFPTNNSFNYVITMNKYNSKYEQFDINHAE